MFIHSFIHQYKCTDLVVLDVLHLAGEGDVVADPHGVVGESLQEVGTGVCRVPEC